MCKPSVPKMPALPAPRAMSQSPIRAGAAASATMRASSYASRSQVPQFALPVLTAKLGGVPMVLGG